MSSRQSELLVRLATALARTGGLASLRFDFSGNGESGGRFRQARATGAARDATSC
jgi:alpha/beta superfamily hydrolase